MTTKTTSSAPTSPTAKRAGSDPAVIEAALGALAEHIEHDDDQALPADARVRTPSPQQARAFLEQFADPAELDRVSRGGRPSMSGEGISPKRQVRLPADVDAALVRRAKVRGVSVSEVLRDALRDALADELRPPAA